MFQVARNLKSQEGTLKLCLAKFISLCAGFCSASLDDARRLLSSSADSFAELDALWPVCYGGALAKQLASSTLLPMRESGVPRPQMIESFRKRLGYFGRKGDVDDDVLMPKVHSRIQAALGELSEWSAFEPTAMLFVQECVFLMPLTLLRHFEPELTHYLTSDSAACRDKAYEIIARLLKSSPDSAARVLPAYYECLKSHE